jgi:hypothetical protein
MNIFGFFGFFGRQLLGTSAQCGTMRVCCLKLLVGLICSVVPPLSSPVWGAGEGLPRIETVLRNIAERARSPHGPEPDGYDLCTKQTITEEFDKTGRVIQRKVKVGESHPPSAGAADASTWSSQNGISLDEELLRRYSFTIVRRELFNGRHTLLVTFIPRTPPPPVKRLQDRVLNQTLGTIWVDEAESELVKAEISLGEPVGFGILGAIRSFHFAFERVRDGEGNWLTKWTDTSINARKFLTPIQTRKRVDWSDFRKRPNAR